jgi:hypothetical protein
MRRKLQRFDILLTTIERFKDNNGRLLCLAANFLPGIQFVICEAIVEYFLFGVKDFF